MVMGHRTIRGLICLFLAITTIAAYHTVIHNSFINFDDPDYVVENPHVQQGVTLEGIGWAFTHGYAGNWHPLTWISHMIDSEFFGLNAGAHHAVNLVFHILNAILLFIVLDRMTSALWHSALVAALFALHPVHVESVAWVAERKDVLSTLFFMLTLLAYKSYTTHRTHRTYLLTLLPFALGLMSKPMLVTLPFVLLLLDFWPLGQMPGLIPTNGRRLNFAVAWPLVREKWPLFLLAVLSSVITFIAQKTGGAVASLQYYSISYRIENAVVAYIRYLEKTIWPANLAVSYPLLTLPVWQIAGAAAILILISWAAIRFATRRPYVIVGWLWFIGTLVPVIGLVQVGRQAFADRYTYIPLIGVFIAIVWTAADLLPRSRHRTWLAGVVAAVVLLACAWRTSTQVAYWKNSLALFAHAQIATKNNALAHNNLAAALAAADHKSEAFPHYAEAVRLEPLNPVFQNNYGTALMRKGQPEAAVECFLKAIQLQPKYADPYNNLGTLLVQERRLDEAIAYFERALQLKPDDVEAHNNLGGALSLQGKTADAAAHYAEALRLNPKNAETHYNLGIALLKLGRPADAATHLAEAVRLRPDSVEARSQLGRCLALRGEVKPAAEQFAEVLRLKPDDADAHFYLALLQLTEGQSAIAVQNLREAIRLRPEWIDALDVLASVLASAPDERVRNGSDAVNMAERAASLSGRRRPNILNTLAAAYAEAGRFDDALATGREALQLARDSGDTNLMAIIQSRLTLFESHQPFRQIPAQ